MDASGLRRKLKLMRNRVRADRFKPDVMDFTRKSLATASRLTPVRSYQLIRENQIGKEGSQYDRWLAQGGGDVSRSAFLAARAPARFLYKASWGQVARSLNLFIPESAEVLAATTRRNPAEDPPMGYAQEHGGKHVYSISIHNPFLEIPSRYKSFTGRQIIGDAVVKHEAQFRRKVASRMKRIIYAVMHS